MNHSFVLVFYCHNRKQEDQFMSRTKSVPPFPNLEAYLGVVLGELVQHVDLELGGLPVLLHVLDYLDRDNSPLNTCL